MIRDSRAPNLICPGNVGSGRSRWADLDVEDGVDLAVASNLGVWASVSSDDSDDAERKAAHREKTCRQNESSSESDSSGHPGQAELGGKRVATPLWNSMPQSSAACHHITFPSDSSRSDSDPRSAGVVGYTGVHTPSNSSRGTDSLSNRDSGGRDCLGQIRSRHMLNVGEQGYIDSFPGSMSSGHDGTAASLLLQRMDVNPSASAEASVQALRAQSRPVALPEPIDGSEQLPSVGSALHASGSCKACLFMISPSGCQQGALCDFCHFKHARSMRPSRRKRDRFKRILERAELFAADCTGSEGREAARALLAKGWSPFDIKAGRTRSATAPLQMFGCSLCLHGHLKSLASLPS
eukprot:TRINITY_DN4324_c0_g1_i2.p1 TRINITY_DN4324_c0_g1~~TRINITY_DN4324_c0_g1_i2.p1  ORF type:complete len:352 (-),score=22.92 TRINITY_DN4324_c0_g1_i2:312-1367(-)